MRSLLFRPGSRSSSSVRFVDDRGRGRRRRTTTILVLLLSCITTASFGQEPQVRSKLNLPDDIWVGERLVLIVELLAPGIFSGTAAFDLPDPPGVQLFPPSDSPVLSNEQINGTSYTVQRHEVLVFPQRAGEVKIPALTVRFGYKRSPLDTDVVAASVKTEPVQFTAKMPAGAEKLKSIISARNLKVVEQWKPEPGKAKAGDAFTRTIIYSAPDVPAMAFPPFPAQPIEGLGIYPKPPEVMDHSDRGTLSGERRDTITYVCQRPGQFVIPAVRLTWFDLDAYQLRTIDFPARTLDVSPNPAMETAAMAIGSDRRPMLRWIATGGLLLLGAGIVIAWRRQLRHVVRRCLAPLRPIHLQPLNPTQQT